MNATRTRDGFLRNHRLVAAALRLLRGLGFLGVSALVVSAAGEVEPVDKTEVTPGPLAAWRFRGDALTNDLGCPPISGSQPRVAKRKGTGVAFTARAERTADTLRYPAVWMSAGQARTNFNFSNGTLRLTYTPDWYHGSPEDQPGQWCRLVECGSWALSVDPSGRRLVFQSPDLSGGVVTNMVAEVPRMPTGEGVVVAWELLLAYTPTRVWLQLNDTFAGYSNVGVSAIPGLAVREQGVHLGSGANGAFPAQGTITEFETFRGAADTKPFSDNMMSRLLDTRARRTHLLRARDMGDGIELAWNRGWEGDSKTNSTLYGISRRPLGSVEWTVVVPEVREQTWTDKSAVPGVYYEYRIGRNPTLPAAEISTIAAARRGAVIDDRGTAILVVDETVAKPLERDLQALRRDLRADGWRVVTTNVPRHVDLAYPVPNEQDYLNRAIPENAIRTQRIKAFIKAQYSSNPTRPHVAFLIGHIPIPYSGFANNLDGHPEHTGAYPADAWYGDMTGLWSDRLTKPAGNVINNNIAGDGRLDQDTLPMESDGSPGRLEVGVGRIDFSYLPSLSGGSSLENTEIRLLRGYLDKASRWRRGALPAEDSMRAWISSDARFAQLVPSAQRIQSRLSGRFELDPAELSQDSFLSESPVLWGIHGDFGGFDAVGPGGGPHQHNATSAADSGRGGRPRAMFTLYFGSYFNEWFHWKDDLLRVLVASPDSVLAATWLNVWQGTVWRPDRFELGAPYVTALQDTFAANANTSCRSTALMGDPFLREHSIPPVASVTATVRSGVTLLNWPAHRWATDGFRIYRSADDGGWVAVGEVDSTMTHWVDRASPGTNTAYMVKALALRTTGAGSYTNSSLGTVVNGASRRKR